MKITFDCSYIFWKVISGYSKLTYVQHNFSTTVKLMLQACLRLLQNTVNVLWTTSFSFIQSAQETRPYCSVSALGGSMGCPPERDTGQSFSYYFLLREHTVFPITQEIRRTSPWGYAHIYVTFSKHKWQLYFWEFWIPILQKYMLALLYKSDLMLSTNLELHLAFQHEVGRHVCIVMRLSKI